ncbi:MAG: hypothetical protein ACXVY9_02835 [Terriglobales bacterium]
MLRIATHSGIMTHSALVDLAVRWLRISYRCGIVLSEQACCTGEIPDVIGWKARCRSVLVECKVSRGDFLGDRHKPWRLDPSGALGCERFYMAPAGLISPAELPPGWGLLEVRGRKVEIAVACSKRKSLRTPDGLLHEMNLLLASLRRVEIRIEPQTITDFLKWENRLARYNGGALPEGVDDPTDANAYLQL